MLPEWEADDVLKHLPSDVLSLFEGEPKQIVRASVLRESKPRAVMSQYIYSDA